MIVLKILYPKFVFLLMTRLYTVVDNHIKSFLTINSDLYIK